MGRFGLCLMLLLGTVDAASAAVLEFPVDEDTWIDGLTSTNPRGADTELGICPVAMYWMYFKFDLSTVSGPVTDAELRITRFDGINPIQIRAYEVTDDGWSEATLTGVTRPAPVNPPNSTWLARGEALVGYDRWRNDDLTSFIAAEAAGDGVLSLMLRENADDMLDIRFYRSKEAPVPADEKPRLLLLCNQAETTELAATSASDWVWTEAPASDYDLVSGTLQDLRADAGAAGASCVADAAAAGYTDSEPDPAPGEGRYLLVRSSGSCGVSSYGTSSSGVERDPTAGCP